MTWQVIMFLACFLTITHTVLASGDCPNNSTGNPCKNYGVCIPAPNGHSCMCKAGWTGSKCETDVGNVITQRISTDNGIDLGKWLNTQRCKTGYFAIGVKVKIETRQGSGDDTAINRLAVICGPPDGSRNGQYYLCQGLTNWGDWSDAIYCPPNYYIVGFNQVSDDDSGSHWDDCGVSMYRFICRGPGLRGNHITSLLTPNHNIWGSWGSNIQQCSHGQAMCAYDVRSLPYQGDGYWDDNMGITDTNFYCCEFDHEPARYVLRNLQYRMDDPNFVNQTLPAVAIAEATLENSNSEPVQISKTLTSKVTTSDSLARIQGISNTVSIDVEFSFGKAGISFGWSHTDFSTSSWNKTVTRELDVSSTITLTVPPYTIGQVKIMVVEAKSDIPYWADLVTYYKDSTPVDTRRIYGIWKNVHVVKTYVSIPPNMKIKSMQNTGM